MSETYEINVGDLCMPMHGNSRAFALSRQDVIDVGHFLDKNASFYMLSAGIKLVLVIAIVRYRFDVSIEQATLIMTVGWRRPALYLVRPRSLAVVSIP